MTLGSALAFAQGPSITPIPGRPAFKRGEVLVKFTNPTSASLGTTSVGATLVRRIESSDWYLARLPQGMTENDAVRRFRALPTVRGAHPNYYLQLFRTPNDPLYASQYEWPICRFPQAWDITTGLPSVQIGIVDTGIQNDHPDLASKIDDYRTFVPGGLADVNGHGTAVAGSAGALGDNGIGVAGAAWGARFLIAKASEERTLPTDAVVGGIYFCADSGAKIINLSLGSFFANPVMQDAVNHAMNVRRCLVVAAAGNEDTNQPSYPAAFPGVLAVAATDNRDRFADFTNFGNWVHVAAPGAQVTTTFTGGQYGLIDGTSFSSPITAGAAALVWSAGGPNVTANQVRRALEQTADPLGRQGRKSVIFGRINVRRAIEFIAPLIFHSASVVAAGLHPNADETGVRDRVETVDGQTQTMASQPIDRVGQVAALRVTYRTSEALASIQSSTFLAAFANVPTGSSVQLFARNANGRFVLLNQRLVTAGLGNWAAPTGPRMKDFLDASGEVTLLFRIVNPVRGGQMPPEFSADVEELRLQFGVRSI